MSAGVQRRLHIILTAAAFAGCLFFSVPAALILLGFSAALFIISEYSMKKRREKALSLSDNIDRILRGAESIRFDEYQEGELSVLSAEVHKMTVRLREQNSALLNEKIILKESLEDISHQLRTPLTSIMLILGMMRTPELSREKRMEHIRELYELLERMNWLIETMLSLSRIEAKAVQFRMEKVSCRELIRMASEPVAVSMELKGVDFLADFSGEPEFVGDLRFTAEAITNLLKNSTEHTPSGGRITVGAQTNGLYTAITITDTGEGIPEKELPHIFQRFYRSSEYTKNGFGIGLAFAQKVISEQGGSLRAENVTPHGARFEIRFYKTTV